MQYNENDPVIQDVVATQDKLSDAVSMVLGFRANMKILAEGGRDGKARVIVTSDPLELTGPARFLFKELRIGTFGGMFFHGPNDPRYGEVFASFELHFDYTHHSYGNNGCPAGFAGKRLLATLKSVKRAWTWDIEVV